MAETEARNSRAQLPQFLKSQILNASRVSSQSERPSDKPLYQWRQSLKSSSIISLLAWAKQNRIELVCKVAAAQKADRQQPEYGDPPVSRYPGQKLAYTPQLGVALPVLPVVVGSRGHLLVPDTSRASVVM